MKKIDIKPVKNFENISILFLFINVSVPLVVDAEPSVIPLDPVQSQMVARTDCYTVSGLQFATLVKVSVTTVMDCEGCPVLNGTTAKLTAMTVPLQDHLPYFLELLGTDIPLIFQIFL